MPDQDFNIKVVTTADTTGIRQTEAELTKLQRQQATFAETARRQQAAAAAAAARATPAVSDTVGLTGTAVGVGTIITLLTSAVNKWKAFNDEQDKWVEGMIKAQEKSRELGLSVADMLDAMKSAERIETEPLQISFDRLKQKVIELKTEMNLAFEAGQYDDVKRYAAALGVVESQIRGVTSAMRQQTAEQEKQRQEQTKKQEEAYGAASPQAKAILENEKRAREARAQGDEKSAEQFQKSAEQFRKSASPADLAAVQAVADTYGKAPILSDIEKNQKAFHDYWNQPGMAEATGQAQSGRSTPLTNPPPNEDMIATPIKEVNSTLTQLLNYMKSVWGPM